MNRSCFGVCNLHAWLVVILAVPWLVACGFDAGKSANQLKNVVEPTLTSTDASPASNVVAYSPSSTPPPTDTEIPSPTSTVTPVPPTATPVVYSVQSGDTLAAIAERFGVKVDEILAVNSVSNPDSLSIGDELIIPSRDEGDSESAVAQADTAESSSGPAASTAQASEGTGGASDEASSGDGISPEDTPIVIEVPDVGDAGEIHYVAEGETLSSIAEQYSVSLDALLMANGIRSDAQLMAGEPLVIPKGTPTPAPTRTPTPAPLVASPTPTSVSIEALSEPATTTLRAESLSPTPTDTPVPPTPTPIVYTVQRGDTPGRIARQFGVTSDELLAANPGMNPTGLQVGDKVTIPSDTDAVPTATPTSTPMPANMVYTEYEVGEEETLSDIAEAHDISATVLGDLNNGVSDEGAPEAGTTLRVPIGTATPSPTATAIPTRTPTPGPKYIAPFPLSPKSKNVVRAKRPVLSWASTGILAEDEFYGVRVRFVVNSDVIHTESFQTRRTSLRLPADLELPSGRLILARWDVLVMREIENGQETTEEAVSSLSTPAEFFWRR